MISQQRIWLCRDFEDGEVAFRSKDEHIEVECKSCRDFTEGLCVGPLEYTSDEYFDAVMEQMETYRTSLINGRRV